MKEEDVNDIFKLMDKLFNENLYGAYSYRRSNIPENRIYQKEEKPKEDIDDKLIDVSEDDKFIYITIELRGVAEEDLTVTPKEQSIFISVVIDGKTLSRDYPLPCKVNPKTAKIKFNNCILDVVLRKVKEKKKQ
jgi:HSP20 family molecular chaperone IbpA